MGLTWDNQCSLFKILSWFWNGFICVCFHYILGSFELRLIKLISNLGCDYQIYLRERLSPSSLLFATCYSQLFLPSSGLLFATCYSQLFSPHIPQVGILNKSPHFTLAFLELLCYYLTPQSEAFCNKELPWPVLPSPPKQPTRPSSIDRLFVPHRFAIIFYSKIFLLNPLPRRLAPSSLSIRPLDTSMRPLDASMRPLDAAFVL